MSRTFLSAEWRYLAMLNYRVAPDTIVPYVPEGTQLDQWNGVTYVSVVGFLFANTRVLGLPIPLHRTFEEINLRIYVRRDERNEIRRGVTFIREVVPRRAIAFVAQAVYNEPYRAFPMRHHIRADSAEASADYEWRGASGWTGVHLSATGAPEAIRSGSEEAFIAEHDWGYTRQRDGSTVEYEVRHPKWKIWSARTARLAGDVADVYPPPFAALVNREPDSAFLADGSAVTVQAPRRIGRGALRGTALPRVSRGVVARSDRTMAGQLDMSDAAAVPRRITGYHQDDVGDWVAELECGHGQHVRHNPPWQVRPWVVTDAGRAEHLGTTLSCVLCATEGRTP